MTNKSAARPIGEEIEQDTRRANRGVMPTILTDVYGTTPPRAAEFGKGISDQAGAREAAEKQRGVKPGQYYRGDAGQK